MEAVATSAAGGLNQPTVQGEAQACESRVAWDPACSSGVRALSGIPQPMAVTKMQNMQAMTECVTTPGFLLSTGSDERSKMACKPSCRLTAVAAPPAATHRKPAAEQAGRALSAGRASVMVPAGERGVIMLRCSGAVRVAPMRVRAGSGRPLSASALAGAAVRSATAWSMRILCAVCGRRCPSEMSESFKILGFPADAG